MVELELEPARVARGSVTLIAFADPPLPGRCLPALLEGYPAEWVAGLYGAMLRDTLDGLQSVAATDHVVIASCDDDEGCAAIARQLPVPWRLAARDAPLAAGLLVLARSEAPTATIDPLVAWLDGAPEKGPIAVVGRGAEDDEAWLYATSHEGGPLTASLHDAAAMMTFASRALRERSTLMDSRVHELPPASLIRSLPKVTELLEELRRHPERAPRTAQYIVTRS